MGLVSVQKPKTNPHLALVAIAFLGAAFWAVAFFAIGFAEAVGPLLVEATFLVVEALFIAEEGFFAAVAFVVAPVLLLAGFDDFLFVVAILNN